MFRWIQARKHSRMAVSLGRSLLEEDDTIYRNQLLLASKFLGSVTPTFVGLFRARFCGACFPIFAFSDRWPDRDDDLADLKSELTLISAEIKGDVVHEGEYAFMEDVQELLARTAAALRFELGTPLNHRELGAILLHGRLHAPQGIRDLLNLGHEALAQSIGKERYSLAIRNALEPTLISRLNGRIRELAAFIQQLR